MWRMRNWNLIKPFQGWMERNGIWQVIPQSDGIPFRQDEHFLAYPTSTGSPPRPHFSSRVLVSSAASPCSSLLPFDDGSCTKAIICISLILRRFTKYYNVQLSVPGRFHSEEFNADIISSHPTLLLPWAPLGVCACRSLVDVVVLLVLFSFARM